MLTVTAIPAFNDNYLWLLENEQECWVVDPGDAAPVKDVLKAKNRQLTGILVTHHHPDHIGGIKDLIRPNMPVIGPAISPYKLVNDPVSEGMVRQVCGIDFQVIDVPGHTLNHLAYFAQPKGHQPSDQQPVLFCGDTLFAGGCGRLFEGTPEQMHHSLSKLSNLPAETLVYCAHEYTLANLSFALHVEPNNQTLKTHYAKMQTLRENGLPTIPSNIGIEKQINPFLRMHSEEIQHSAKHSAKTSEASLDQQPTETFAAIRRMKDSF